MTSIKLLALPFALIMMAALLCWFIITAKGRWWIKLFLILAVPSFGLVVWRAMPSYAGWPADERPTGRAMLLWVEVREPLPREKDPGAIYVWIVRLEDGVEDPRMLAYRAARGEPRAHRLAYSRRSHEMADAAREMIKNGRPVVIEMNGLTGEGGDGETDGDDAGEGRPDGNGGPNYRNAGPDDFLMYELPDPVFPDKDN